MNTEWNVGTLLFGIEITLLGIALELAGGGAIGFVGVIIGFAVCFSGLIARPRTGP